MRTLSPPSRSWLPWVVSASFALARCSSSPPPTPTPVNPNARTSGGSSIATQAVELSPVPAPDALVGVVRIPSPRGFARDLGQRLGLGTFLVQGMESALPATVGDDEGLANAIDLDAPTDIVLGMARNDVRVIVAFGAVSMPRAEDVLSQGHRLTTVEPASAGIRRIQLVRDGAPVEDSSIHCVLAPILNTTRDGARIVCAERYADIAPFVAYATRTLPATPVAQGDGNLVAELATDALRNNLADDVQEFTASLDREVGTRPDPNNPQFQDAVRAWVRDTLSPSLSQGLGDLASARAVFKLDDQGARLSFDVGLRTTNAPLLQQAVAATRDARLTQQLLAPLPPGASSYGAASASTEPFRPSLNLLVSAVSRMLIPTTRVPPADATALRTALTSVFAVNRVTTASAAGQDAQRHAWNVTAYQSDIPASQYVSNVRNLFTALRRPAVARAIRADLHVDPMTFRIATAAGMPAGTLLVQMPAPPRGAAASGASDDNPLAFLRRMLNASDSAFELLLVPDGNTVWSVSAADARARYREARANHPPPPEVPGLQDEGVVAAGAFLPLGLAHSIARFDESMGRNLERMIAQTPGGGNAPIVVRALAQTREGMQHFTGEAIIPNAALGMVGRGLNQGSAPPPPTAAP